MQYEHVLHEMRAKRKHCSTQEGPLGGFRMPREDEHDPKTLMRLAEVFSLSVERNTLPILAPCTDCLPSHMHKLFTCLHL